MMILVDHHAQVFEITNGSLVFFVFSLFSEKQFALSWLGGATNLHSLASLCPRT